MKKLLLLLFFVTTQLFAGSFTDDSNFLGPQGRELNSRLANLPVFIETHERVSDLRGYADSRVRSLTDRGFLLVITTNPRGWRISMTPQGVVSSEQTRLIGDRMTSQFKNGRLYEGLLGASSELSNLIRVSTPSPVAYTPPPQPIRQSPPVETPRHVDTPRPAPQNDDSSGVMIFFVSLLVIGSLAIGIYFLVKYLNRPKTTPFREPTPTQKPYVPITKNPDFDLTPKSTAVTPVPTTKIETPQVKPVSRKSNLSSVRPSTPKPKTKEQKAFDKFTESERREIVRRHGGSSVTNHYHTSSDPMLFYAFYLMSLNSHSHSDHSSYTPPAPSYTPPSRSQSDDDDSYRRSSSSSSSFDWGSSSSDSSGSSSSFDFGSSSSDSSGSSGSW